MICAAALCICRFSIILKKSTLPTFFSEQVRNHGKEYQLLVLKDIKNAENNRPVELKRTYPHLVSLKKGLVSTNYTTNVYEIQIPLRYLTTTRLTLFKTLRHTMAI